MIFKSSDSKNSFSKNYFKKGGYNDRSSKIKSNYDKNSKFFNKNKNNNNSFILKIYKELIDKTNNFTKSLDPDENTFNNLITTNESSMFFLTYNSIIVDNNNNNKNIQSIVDMMYGLNYFSNDYINKSFYSIIFYIISDYYSNNSNKTNYDLTINIKIEENISFYKYYKKTVFNSYFDPFNNKLNEFYKFIEYNINKNNLKNNLLNQFINCYNELQLNINNINKETINNAFTIFYDQISDKNNIFEEIKHDKEKNKKKIKKKIPFEYRKILLYLYLLKNCSGSEFNISDKKFIITFDEESIRNFEFISTIVCYLEFLKNKNKLLIDLLRIQYNKKINYNHEEPISIMLNFISFINTFNQYTYAKLNIEFNEFCIDCDQQKNKINNILSNNFDNSNISTINDIFNSNIQSKNISNFKLKIQNKINKLREKYKGTNKEKIINKIEQNYLSKFEGL